MRRLIIKPNPAWNESADPSRFHTHIRLENGTEPRLKLSGFSYFGEIGALRHIPIPSPDGSVVLFPEHEATDWQRLTSQQTNKIRLTYAQYLALLAAHDVNLVRVWLFDLNEGDSYPFFHLFGADKYDLNKASTRYRRRLLRFVDLARKYGIVVHLTIASDQMLRPASWKKMPFYHAQSNGQFAGEDGFTSFLDIGTPEAPKQPRYGILREMVRSVVTAVKPFWNVMFEILNEAGVRAETHTQVVQWHKTVARWLDEDLNDGTGKRTHLVTISAVHTPVNIRGQIINALVHNGENLVDVVSLHGAQWGGPDTGTAPPPEDQIAADTSAKVTALYAAHPGRPFAVICDSDAFPLAQRNPQIYAKACLQRQNLNYAHRWHSSFLSTGGLMGQLNGMKLATPDNLEFPDLSARPAPIPVISAEESALAGVRFEGTFLPKGRDIAALNPTNSVFMIGTNPGVGGNGVWRWTPGTFPAGNWVEVPGGGGTRITVDRDGKPWTIDGSNGYVRRLDQTTWVNIPAPRATDIAAGGDGSVWLLGTLNFNGDHELYRLSGTAWQSVDGTGVRLAVDAVGRPWLVKANGTIQYRDGERWVTMPGTAVDIGAGHDGTVWIAEPNGNIAYWLGTSWRSFPGPAVAVSVDYDGLPWFVTPANVVVRQGVGDVVA
jgi:hypothetical protein